MATFAPLIRRPAAAGPSPATARETPAGKTAPAEDLAARFDATGRPLIDLRALAAASDAAGPEREADGAGARVAATRTAGRAPARGGALSVTIVIDDKGAAMLTAARATGDTVTAYGSATQLEPGDYRVSSTGTSKVVVITHGDGSRVPQTTRFDVPFNAANRAFIEALAGTRADVPLHVESGMVQKPAEAKGGEAAPSGPSEEQRQRLEALPERIKKFLFSDQGRSVRPEEYATLLRIADRIVDLSDAELEEYRARTTGGAGNLASFEASVEAFLARREKEKATAAEADDATRALVGLDAAWKEYGIVVGSGHGIPSPIEDWEKVPVKALPETHDGYVQRAYLRMRRILEPYGYANMDAFDKAMVRFTTAFREHAVLIALEHLDKFEHVLLEQGARYKRGADVTDLHKKLAPARAAFERLDEQYRQGDIAQDYGYKQKVKALGEQHVSSQAESSPLLAAQDFPTEKIGRADQAGIASTLQSYVAEHLEKVRNTRKRILADHEFIFTLDLLVQQTKAREGIAPDSMWSNIIKGHNAPTFEDQAIEVGILILGLALAFATGGGSLVAAAASLGLSSVIAVQQYEDYAAKSDAFGAQLLANEPWFGWVVLAIVGAAGDFAAVSRVLRIKSVLPALREFQAGTTTAEGLKQKLVGVEAKLRDAIVARAKLEAAAAEGFKALGPANTLNASLFGLDFVAKNVARATYSIVLNIRRGANSFIQWARSNEAIRLIGKLEDLNPSQLAKVKALYIEGRQQAQQIMNLAEGFKLEPGEVDAFFRKWVRSGSTDINDLVYDIRSSQRVVISRVTDTGPITRSTLPRGHIGSVDVPGPAGSGLHFEPLDKLGRTQGMEARVTRQFLEQETGAFASGKIVGRTEAQDRAHLLARILGGPDIPHNLTPLLREVNQEEMKLVELELRKAVREGGEASIKVTPSYPASGRPLSPDYIEMVVIWKSGKRKAIKFMNR